MIELRQQGFDWNIMVNGELWNCKSKEEAVNVLSCLMDLKDAVGDVKGNKSKQEIKTIPASWDEVLTSIKELNRLVKAKDYGLLEKKLDELRLGIMPKFEKRKDL
jgi:hypothetical protein